MQKIKPLGANVNDFIIGYFQLTFILAKRKILLQSFNYTVYKKNKSFFQSLQATRTIHSPYITLI